jgi:type VI secretion system protein ImpJ
MFIRPQHFQQQDRHIEALVQGRCEHLRPYGWGVTELTLNQGALRMGKLAIEHCKGVLPDGTPFSIPDQDEAPAPLEIESDWRDFKVLLALPYTQPDAIDVDREQNETSAVRYRAVEYEIRDSVAMPGANREPAPIEIGKRRFRLMAETGTLGDYVKLGVARVRERRADNAIVLDEGYIPPCLDSQSEPILKGFIGEIQGMLRQRGTDLAGRAGASRNASANTDDLTLLQIINRHIPLFNHFAQMSGLHPEEFFRAGLQLAGELATYTRQEKRPPDFSRYQHDDLQTTFRGLIEELRRSLQYIVDPNVIRLPLEERVRGTYLSIIQDPDLLSNATFVLLVKADTAKEMISSQFPENINSGAVEHIKGMVQALIRGVPMSPLPVVPRQLPFREGYVYFELNQKNEYWEQLKSSKAFAFHIGALDRFPGVDMEFWAIRQTREGNR